MTEPKRYDFQNIGGANPHDYFGRKTIGDPLIAADLLRHYADPVIAEHVDLDRLQSEPTNFFGPSHPLTGPKEVMLDVPFIAHLHDPEWLSEVLIIIEHKSAKNLFVPLQVSVHANLSMYKRWTDAGRPRGNRKFKLPIPLMVMLYCGAEDLDDDLVFFQDMFDHIPEALKPYILQFLMLVINLRRFSYDHLPGNPDTRAAVETMMRAFDGTLAEHLPELLERLGAIPIDDRILELIGSIAWYTGRVTDITPERITQAVTNTIKGKGGIEMAEVIQKGIFQQGVEVGEVKGEARGKVEGEIKGKTDAILMVLQARFTQVPLDVVESICKMSDLTALASHLSFAATCSSIDEFAKSLE